MPLKIGKIKQYINKIRRIIKKETIKKTDNFEGTQAK